MFWDKNNKKDSLPDLPALKIPKFPEERVEEIRQPSALPALPHYQDMKEQIVHENISSRDMDEEETLEEPQNEQSISNWHSQEIRQESPEVMPESKSNIFIKLERFQSAKKTIFVIDQKLNEIDNTLKKIRETRMREEQELSAWEREVSELKSRIESVSKSLFEKLG